MGRHQHRRGRAEDDRSEPDQPSASLGELREERVALLRGCLLEESQRGPRLELELLEQGPRDPVDGRHGIAVAARGSVRRHLASPQQRPTRRLRCCFPLERGESKASHAVYEPADILGPLQAQRMSRDAEDCKSL